MLALLYANLAIVICLVDQRAPRAAARAGGFLRGAADRARRRRRRASAAASRACSASSSSSASASPRRSSSCCCSSRLALGAAGARRAVAERDDRRRAGAPRGRPARRRGHGRPSLPLIVTRYAARRRSTLAAAIGRSVPVSHGDGDSQGDRTEKPTAKRLKDARERGQVVAQPRPGGARCRSSAVTIALGWFGARMLARSTTGWSADARDARRSRARHRSTPPALGGARSGPTLGLLARRSPVRRR